MMLGYHFELAVRSLRRNLVLTVLVVVAVGVGIGASMTMLTTLVAMSGNPIPDKSSKLFVPQIDVSGDATHHQRPDWVPRELTYRDAMALMKAHRGVRQTAMYSLELNVDPPQGDPFQAVGRATYSDFFSMFEVPFRSGAAWGPREDDEGQNVVVLSAKLADRLFPHGDPARTASLDRSARHRCAGLVTSGRQAAVTACLTGASFEAVELVRAELEFLEEPGDDVCFERRCFGGAQRSGDGPQYPILRHDRIHRDIVALRIDRRDRGERVADAESAGALRKGSECAIEEAASVAEAEAGTIEADHGRDHHVGEHDLGPRARYGNVPHSALRRIPGGPDSKEQRLAARQHHGESGAAASGDDAFQQVAQNGLAAKR